MQRVLSFQTGRGPGEPTEFVTKRMCCSLIFSVGFLSLLCGFLIGRFAAGRVIGIREEKKKHELYGNGLYHYDHLRNDLLSNLNNVEFDITLNVTKSEILENAKNILLGLNIFNEISGNDSCVIAIIRGSQEPDRHIVLNAAKENIVILLTIAKEFQKIHEDYEWSPKRTIIFLISANTIEACLYSFSNYNRSKIVAYLAIDKTPIEDQGVFLTSGSDMVQTTLLEAAQNYVSFENTHDTAYVQRLKINTPQTIISFHPQINFTHMQHMDEYNQNFTRMNKKNLAQVLSTSIWRLSEMSIFQWDPQMLSKTVKILNAINLPELQRTKENIKTTINSIINSGTIINDKIENIDRLKSLNIRMMNDFLKDLEQALLCPDKNYESQTDLAVLQQRINNKNIQEYLDNMLKCYQDADKLLQDMT